MWCWGAASSSSGTAPPTGARWKSSRSPPPCSNVRDGVGIDATEVALVSAARKLGWDPGRRSSSTRASPRPLRLGSPPDVDSPQIGGRRGPLREGGPRGDPRALHPDPNERRPGRPRCQANGAHRGAQPGARGRGSGPRRREPRARRRRYQQKSRRPRAPAHPPRIGGDGRHAPPRSQGSGRGVRAERGSARCWSPATTSAPRPPSPRKWGSTKLGIARSPAPSLPRWTRTSSPPSSTT